MPRVNLKGTFSAEFELSKENASTAASVTLRMFKVPAGKKVRIESVQYINPTGLAGNDTNFFNIRAVKNASTNAFNWSTAITGGQGTIAADTWVDLVATGGGAQDADRVLAAGDTLSLLLTLTGTQTLPAGTLVAHCRYV